MLLCQSKPPRSRLSPLTSAPTPCCFCSFPPPLPPPSVLILHLSLCCLSLSIFSLITLHLSVNSRPFRASGASRKCQRPRLGHIGTAESRTRITCYYSFFRIKVSLRQVQAYVFAPQCSKIILIYYSTHWIYCNYTTEPKPRSAIVKLH